MSFNMEIPVHIDNLYLSYNTKCVMRYYGGRRVAYPEWLLNATNKHQLPRYGDEGVFNFKYEIVCFCSHSDEIKIGEFIVWVIENCTGGWCLIGKTFVFEYNEDAMAFKLAWC